MNKYDSCDIIKDLLPGYIDGVLSESGTKLVKEHLTECGPCHEAYLEMKEDAVIDIETEAKEQLALDGFKKVRQRTRKLKLAVGIVTGLLICSVLSVLLKIFVIGSPLPTGQISITELSYDEETDRLVINGAIDWAPTRVSRVVWEPCEDEADAVNVLVYGAELLPFGQEQRDFTISIPDMKGQKVYLACPKYDQREIYSWKNSHSEKLLELENEVYDRIPELDREKDILSYPGGIESVNGTEGILYLVDSVSGEDASYRRIGDQLLVEGELESRDFDIWISLEKPYQILVYDHETGEYTEDYSVISSR